MVNVIALAELAVLAKTEAMITWVELQNPASKDHREASQEPSICFGCHILASTNPAAQYALLSFLWKLVGTSRQIAGLTTA